jgi:glycosyltransferase involved in cell wall biosynthesis
MPERRLRILTWHVHGNYLYYLTQVPHDFYLVTDRERSTHHSGRSGTLPWGDNVHDAPVEQLRDMAFDVVLYQSRDTWEHDRLAYLSEAQRRLPCIYLEHDPPLENPTDQRHWAAGPGVMLVHVTHFNALMWDSGESSVRIIEHGVLPLKEVGYEGRFARGIVVVNNIDRRGRRVGLDVYRRAASEVPLTLVGMGSERVGGDGEVPNDRLPETMAAYRFFFNPIRYTSLGLAIIEAMMAGLPIVGLATTELAAVIRNGRDGHVDTRIEALVDTMKHLIADPQMAREWGENARRSAQERFGIRRFVADWMSALAEATS